MRVASTSGRAGTSDALARARTAYAGLAGSGDVDVAKLTVGVQVLRDLCHAVGA